MNTSIAAIDDGPPANMPHTDNLVAVYLAGLVAGGRAVARAVSTSDPAVIPHVPRLGGDQHPDLPCRLSRRHCRLYHSDDPTAASESGITQTAHIEGLFTNGSQ